MSPSVDVHPHGHRPMNLGTLVRVSFTASCISALAGIGLYAAWQNRHSFAEILFSLAATFGPGAMCAFGYFVCLPEVLGRGARGDTRSQGERWSGFARLAAVIAVIIAWIGWSIVLAYASTASGKDRVILVLGIILCPALIPAVNAASEEYLRRTMSVPLAALGTGWRAVARRLSAQFGQFGARVLEARTALAVGSALVLASLLLCLSPYTSSELGYGVLTGRASWITAESTVRGRLAIVIAQSGGWLTYVLGLALAAIGLATVVLGQRGDVLRRWRALTVLSGLVALYGVNDFTFGFQRFVMGIVPIFGIQSPGQRVQEGISVTVWIAALVLPIALWLGRAREGGNRWDRTRLAVMVLYLSIFFFFLAMLPFLLTESLAPGYAAFLLGAVLLWWGFIQSGWETSGTPSASRSVG